MRFISLRTLATLAVFAAAAGIYVGTTGATNPGGTSCTDPINGRGATFQTNAQAAFANGFVTDPKSVCNGASSTLVQYNYAASVGFTGSGNGQKAVSCRTDAYGGTDIPFDEATLALLNGAPGATGSCAIPFTPPNPPNSGTYPDPADQQAQLMVFPVAAGAVGQGYHLTPADCGGVVVPRIKLTAQMVSLLIGGDILKWKDARLRTGGINGKLKNCNIAVTRIVRLDKSGTTQIDKNYLSRVDPNRTGALCSPGTTWTSLAQDANNVNWPTGTGCSTLTRPGTTGNPAVVALCNSTDGAFCYGDIADFVLQGLVSATVRNATDTSFIAPLTKNSSTGLVTQANCDTSAGSLPGSPTPTANDVVNLNAVDNWGIDNPSGNHGNIADVGSHYPVCGVTFGMVYTGLHATTGSAIAALSLNQRQTLYDYFRYVLSGAGQAQLKANYYAPLASNWASLAKTGFSNNY
jgi:hypothetical protein